MVWLSFSRNDAPAVSRSLQPGSAFALGACEVGRGSGISSTVSVRSAGTCSGCCGIDAGIEPVAFSTDSMNFFSRVPPMKTSSWPASNTPANIDFLNANSESIPSSIVPWAMKSTTRTGRCWPRRCTRPIRCSKTAGFHG